MDIKLAIVLGSGIEIDMDKVSDINVLKQNLNGIHRKTTITCKFDGFNLLVIQGRKHYYEGYRYEELTENINIVAELGVKNLILTNAAGGVNVNFNVGDFMLIKSHVNLNNSLIYKKVPFPYNIRLSELFISACIESCVNIHEGVYGYYRGPVYETKAETRFQKKFNIDAAGMSTVPEVNDGYLKGKNVIGISVITNLLKENSAQQASHDEVLRNAKAASENLNIALISLLKNI